MPEKAGIIHIKWVRSGIGFPRRQKEMVKSLGLRRLNQVVARPDTPHIRGLVAKVPHLVAVVGQPARPKWSDLPEYTIVPAEVRPKKSPPAKKADRELPEDAPAAAETTVTAPKVSRKKAAPAKSEVTAPRKKAGVAKSRASESAKKQVSSSTEKPRSRRKVAEPKSTAKEGTKPKKGKK